MMTESERFWNKVNKTAGCWEWTGALVVGYGVFKRRVGGVWKQQKAHRLSYEWLVGPIPGGLFVCHHCDNPKCLNPAHLFLGTARDNQQDMIQKGRKPLDPRKLPPDELRRRKAAALRRWASAHKERNREYTKQWKAKNPERYRAMVERRRVKRKAQRDAMRLANQRSAA